MENRVRLLWKSHFVILTASQPEPFARELWKCSKEVREKAGQLYGHVVLILHRGHPSGEAYADRLFDPENIGCLGPREGIGFGSVAFVDQHCRSVLLQKADQGGAAGSTIQPDDAVEIGQCVPDAMTFLTHRSSVSSLSSAPQSQKNKVESGLDAPIGRLPDHEFLTRNGKPGISCPTACPAASFPANERVDAQSLPQPVELPVGTAE